MAAHTAGSNEAHEVPLVGTLPERQVLHSCSWPATNLVVTHRLNAAVMSAQLAGGVGATAVGATALGAAGASLSEDGTLEGMSDGASDVAAAEGAAVVVVGAGADGAVVTGAVVAGAVVAVAGAEVTGAVVVAEGAAAGAGDGVVKVQFRSHGKPPCASRHSVYASKGASHGSQVQLTRAVQMPETTSTQADPAEGNDLARQFSHCDFCPSAKLALAHALYAVSRSVHDAGGAGTGAAAVGVAVPATGAVVGVSVVLGGVGAVVPVVAAVGADVVLEIVGKVEGVPVVPEAVGALEGTSDGISEAVGVTGVGTVGLAAGADVGSGPGDAGHTSVVGFPRAVC
jgi:hypothetical protein